MNEATEQPTAEAPTPEPARPADHFTTRDGKTVALKAWTLGLITQHAAAIADFVAAWADVAQGGQVDLGRIQTAMPAIEASVQTPEALQGVVGLAELVRLSTAIWEYNEVAVGLGKAVALSFQIQEQIVGASDGALSVPQN